MDQSFSSRQRKQSEHVYIHTAHSTNVILLCFNLEKLEKLNTISGNFFHKAKTETKCGIFLVFSVLFNYAD
jgi:hypothetical protein